MVVSISARFIASAVVATLLMVADAVFPSSSAVAQISGGSQAAEKALQAGLAAQKARNHRDAVGLLSRAINSGALPRKQMTYALYRRAISNRAQKQSAQAISDLNSALFFKGDLSSRDRANAIEERMKAFNDAGLPPTPVATASGASQWTPSTAAKAVPPQASPRVISSAPRRVLEPIRVVKPPQAEALSPTTPILQPVAPRSARREVPSFQTRVATAPAATSKPAAAQSSFLSFLSPKVDRGVGVPKQSAAKRKTPSQPLAPWHVATRQVATKPIAANPATTATGTIGSPAWKKPVVRSPLAKPAASTAIAAAKPVAPTASAPATGQLFSSIFGGASNPQVVTGSVKPTTALPTQAPTARPVAKSAAMPVQVAAAQPVATPRPAAPVSRAPSRYEIEVAVLRSKDRADALAQQLMVQYSGGGFWSAKKTARVLESAGSGEGDARYAVRYGVYNSKDEIGAMCDTFKSNGLACEVVRQN